MFIPLLPVYALQRKTLYAGVDEERKGMPDYVVHKRLCVR